MQQSVTVCATAASLASPSLARPSLALFSHCIWPQLSAAHCAVIRHCGLQVSFNHRLAAERERRTLENDRTSLANAQKR